MMGLISGQIHAPLGINLGCMSELKRRLILRIYQDCIELREARLALRKVTRREDKQLKSTTAISSQLATRVLLR